MEDAARELARVAVDRLRLQGHLGAHPRLGVLDVVPFVALGDASPVPAVSARDAFSAWAGTALGLPCFRYGPLPDGSARTLPEVRRAAFSRLPPDDGPAVPHPTAGAAAVGARGVLVAYNLWLQGRPRHRPAHGAGSPDPVTGTPDPDGSPDVDGGRAVGALARQVARALRGPAVRSLAFELAHGVQVSCNLVDPATTGPAEVYDAVTKLLGGTGVWVARCELVGLVPAQVLARIPSRRWAMLDLAPDRTIEARTEAAGLGT